MYDTTNTYHSPCLREQGRMVFEEGGPWMPPNIPKQASNHPKRDRRNFRYGTQPESYHSPGRGR